MKHILIFFTGLACGGTLFWCIDEGLLPLSQPKSEQPQNVVYTDLAAICPLSTPESVAVCTDVPSDKLATDVIARTAEIPAETSAGGAESGRTPHITELAAPEFDNRTPEVLHANSDGEVLIRWRPVEHANRYKIIVFDQEGREIKSVRTKRNYIYLRDIPVADNQLNVEYQVALASMAGASTVSRLGPRRQLLIKNFSRIVAPTIKVIQVED